MSQLGVGVSIGCLCEQHSSKEWKQQAAEDKAKTAAAEVKRQATTQKREERLKVVKDKETVKKTLHALGYINDKQASANDWRTISVEIYRTFLAKQHPGSTISVGAAKKSKPELFADLQELVLLRLAGNSDLVDCSGQHVPAEMVRTKWAQVPLPMSTDGEDGDGAAEAEMGVL